MRQIDRRRAVMGVASAGGDGMTIVVTKNMCYLSNCVAIPTPHDIHIMEITFDTPITPTSITASVGLAWGFYFWAEDADGNQVMKAGYTPSPNTAVVSGSIKKLHLTVRGPSKEQMYFRDNNGVYYLDGSTFDWASYGIT